MPRTTACSRPFRVIVGKDVVDIVAVQRKEKFDRIV